MVEFVLLLFCQEVTLLALLEVWFVIIVPTPDGSWKTFEMPSARRVSSRQPVILLKEKRGRGPLPGPFSLASLNGSLVMWTRACCSEDNSSKLLLACREERFCLGSKPWRFCGWSWILPYPLSLLFQGHSKHIYFQAKMVSACFHFSSKMYHFPPSSWSFSILSGNEVSEVSVVSTVTLTNRFRKHDWKKCQR